MKPTQTPAPESPTLFDLCKSLDLVVHVHGQYGMMVAPDTGFDSTGDVLARLAAAFLAAGHSVIVSEIPGIVGPFYRVEKRHVG
jgi:hypothetical protein